MKLNEISEGEGKGGRRCLARREVIFRREFSLSRCRLRSPESLLAKMRSRGGLFSMVGSTTLQGRVATLLFFMSALVAAEPQGGAGGIFIHLDFLFSCLVFPSSLLLAPQGVLGGQAF